MNDDQIDDQYINPEWSDDMARRAPVLYSKATTMHVGEEDNRESIDSTFRAMVHEEFGEGKLLVNVETLITEKMLRLATTNASGNTGRLIKDLALGQVEVSDLNYFLDAALIVGKNHRTTLRHVKNDDLDRMVRVRFEDAEEKMAAAHRFRDYCAVVKSALNHFGSIESALLAGAFSAAESA